MIYVTAFIVLSIPIVILSWKSLKHRKSHGFYRFFSWEAILVLIIFNIKYWFTNPFSLHQIFSWILLFISIWFVVAGTITLKKQGKQKNIRSEENLYAIEKTSELVKTGIYKYIRHPLYSSLLFLTGGIFLKHPDWILLNVAVFAITFLYLTARVDEKECINYFGETYREYMKTTKRFIPFIF
jgi:protein-S-isoprenylcysteine O-methyltransferase Ste14